MSDTPRPAGNRGANKRAIGLESNSEIMGFLMEYIGTHGYAPTQHEIAAGTKRGVATVRRRLQVLEAEGMIRRGPGSRAIVILG